MPTSMRRRGLNPYPNQAADYYLAREACTFVLGAYIGNPRVATGPSLLP